MKNAESVMPMRWFLMATGIWYPSTSSRPVLKLLLRVFGALLLLSTAVGTVSVYFINCQHLHKKIGVLIGINGVSTVTTFLGPALWIYLYLRTDHFASMVDRVYGVKSLERLSVTVSVVFFIIWISVATFFFFHWRKFLMEQWQIAVYVVVTLVLILPWASGLSIFIFCARVYMKDTEIQEDKISRWLTSSSSEGIEDNGILDEDLEYSIKERSIKVINKMLKSWSKTSFWLNYYISWQVSAHVFDVIIYSCTFWEGNFGPRYPNIQYLGTLILDTAGVVLCVYFAGQVSAVMHQITKSVGALCVPVRRSGLKIPYERIDLYCYLHAVEQHVGLKIVGIRITINIALITIVTITTATMSFTAFIIPRLGESDFVPVNNTLVGGTSF